MLLSELSNTYVLIKYITELLNYVLKAVFLDFLMDLYMKYKDFVLVLKGIIFNRKGYRRIVSLKE